MEYEIIKKKSGVLTNWQYVFFTENDLMLSPLAVWEYLSVRLRDPKSKIIKADEFNKALHALKTVMKRFSAKSSIDTLTMDIAVLFAGATGVPCDDSYHFIHAVKNGADFFVTADTKHFSFTLTRYLKQNRVQVIDRMIKSLRLPKSRKDVNLANLRLYLLSYLRSLRIKKEVVELSKCKWPIIITQPVEIP